MYAQCFGFANDSACRSIRVDRALLRSGLFALLLACTPWAQATDRVVLTQRSPTPTPSGVVDIQPGTTITLSVEKTLDGAGMPDQPVDWNVSGPGSAALTATRSLTSAKDDSHAAGIASTGFSASKPGTYVVTARTQQNPGCVPAISRRGQPAAKRC